MFLSRHFIYFLLPYAVCLTLSVSLFLDPSLPSFPLPLVLVLDLFLPLFSPSYFHATTFPLAPYARLYLLFLHFTLLVWCTNQTESDSGSLSFEFETQFHSVTKPKGSISQTSLSSSSLLHISPDLSPPYFNFVNFLPVSSLSFFLSFFFFLYSSNDIPVCYSRTLVPASNYCNTQSDISISVSKYLCAKALLVPRNVSFLRS